MTNVRLLGLPETGPNKGRSDASDFAQDEMCAFSGEVAPAILALGEARVGYL